MGRHKRPSWQIFRSRKRWHQRPLAGAAGHEVLTSLRDKRPKRKPMNQAFPAPTNRHVQLFWPIRRCHVSSAGGNPPWTIITSSRWAIRTLQSVGEPVLTTPCRSRAATAAVVRNPCRKNWYNWLATAILKRAAKRGFAPDYPRSGNLRFSPSLNEIAALLNRGVGRSPWHDRH